MIISDDMFLEMLAKLAAQGVSVVREEMSGVFSPFEWYCLGIIGVLNGIMVGIGIKEIHRYRKKWRKNPIGTGLDV